MKQRLDKVLVEKGMVPSRQKAQGHIMAGEVTVDGVAITKAGHLVNTNAVVEIVKKGIPFVSRGGLKLDAALKHFNVDIAGKVAMDIGSSTGGFTDCLLKRGAKRVYAVDVGYGLMDVKLRRDERVVLLERINFRYIEREAIPECIDIGTVDVSFISVMRIVPRAVEFLCSKAELLVLIKPQFEVGKGEVGKGGIVRDRDKRLAAVDRVSRDLSSSGMEQSGLFESPVRGQKGNVEYFLYLKKG